MQAHCRALCKFHLGLSLTFKAVQSLSLLHAINKVNLKVSQRGSTFKLLSYLMTHTHIRTHTRQWPEVYDLCHTFLHIA